MSAATKRKRTMRLFEEQGGLCWICGFRMLKPKPGTGQPSKWTATLDHLEPRLNLGVMRPAKAAHKGCNSARGHDEVLAAHHLKAVRTKFANPGWIRSTFYAEENE